MFINSISVIEYGNLLIGTLNNIDSKFGKKIVGKALPKTIIIVLIGDTLQFIVFLKNGNVIL